MIGTVVYMVCGMAIISMVFNLMQEEVVTKFRWIGQKCGCIKHDDEDDQEEEVTGGGPNSSGKPTAGGPPGSSVPRPDLGTGNRNNIRGRIAAPQPIVYPPQFGAVGGGYAPYGFPMTMAKQPASYARGSAAGGHLGPNAEFAPPPTATHH